MLAVSYMHEVLSLPAGRSRKRLPRQRAVTSSARFWVLPLFIDFASISPYRLDHASSLSCQIYPFDVFRYCQKVTISHRKHSISLSEAAKRYFCPRKDSNPHLSLAPYKDECGLAHSYATDCHARHSISVLADCVLPIELQEP